MENLVYIINFCNINAQLSNRIIKEMKFNHIILITQDFPSDAGGIQTWCVELAKKYVIENCVETDITVINNGVNLNLFNNSVKD